jgi:hypothetical protein
MSVDFIANKLASYAVTPSSRHSANTIRYINSCAPQGPFVTVTYCSRYRAKKEEGVAGRRRGRPAPRDGSCSIELHGHGRLASTCARRIQTREDDHGASQRTRQRLWPNKPCAIRYFVTVTYCSGARGRRKQPEGGADGLAGHRATGAASVPPTRENSSIESSKWQACSNDDRGASRRARQPIVQCEQVIRYKPQHSVVPISDIMST